MNVDLHPVRFYVDVSISVCIFVSDVGEQGVGVGLCLRKMRGGALLGLAIRSAARSVAPSRALMLG